MPLFYCATLTASKLYFSFINQRSLSRTLRAEENDRRTSNFAGLASSQETDRRFFDPPAWTCQGGKEIFFPLCWCCLVGRGLYSIEVYPIVEDVTGFVF